jgi:hypothetical protein
MTLRRHLFGVLIGIGMLAGAARSTSAQVIVTDSPRVHGVQVVRHSPHRVHRVRHVHRRVIVRHSHVRHTPRHHVVRSHT